MPLVRKCPRILVADTTPLIHLAAIGELHLLNDMAEIVVVVDLVQYEAVADLTKSYAKEIDEWIQAGLRPGSNAPVRVEKTDTGETFKKALLADPEHRMAGGGETAIIEWLAENIEGSDEKTIVIYENGKVPRKIDHQNLDADVLVATTRAFLRIAQEFGLIPSAKDMWNRLMEVVPTANHRDQVFHKRRDEPDEK